MLGPSALFSSFGGDWWDGLKGFKVNCQHWKALGAHGNSCGNAGSLPEREWFSLQMTAQNFTKLNLQKQSQLLYFKQEDRVLPFTFFKAQLAP